MTNKDTVRELFPAIEPDHAVPPGETLRELIDELGMTQAELARRAQLSSKHINQLIQGVVPLSADVATRLELVTGMPARLWNRLEADYQSALERLRLQGALAAEAGWIDQIPVRELVKRGVLPEKPGDKISRVAQLLAFFGVASVNAWKEIYSTPDAAFRQSNAFTILPGSVATWLRLGELAARDISCAPYNEARLREAVRELRSLTRLAPSKFGPRLGEVCSSAGVAVVFIEEIAGTRACGATRWLTPEKALVQLSCRYRTDDQLWFTIFHELGHLVRHGKREVWIDDGRSDDPREDEANAFAAEQLIPRRYAARLAQLRSLNDVETFALDVGVSPGIVVGRLQHDKLWKPTHGNKLKRHVSVSDLTSLA